MYSDEGLTFETSAVHQSLWAKHIPSIPVGQNLYPAYSTTQKKRRFFKTNLLPF